MLRCARVQPFSVTTDGASAANRTQLVRQRKMETLRSVLARDGRGDDHMCVLVVWRSLWDVLSSHRLDGCECPCVLVRFVDAIFGGSISCRGCVCCDAGTALSTQLLLVTRAVLLHSPSALDDLAFDHPIPTVTQGLGTLSRTLSELKIRKRELQREEATKAAPTKPPGVHKEKLQSFSATLGSSGVWYQDKSHLNDFKGTGWEGSELEGSQRLDTTGLVKSGNGRRVCAETMKPLISTGLHVEMEYPTDTTRMKDIPLGDVATNRKKRTDFYEKPNKVRRWQDRCSCVVASVT